MGLVAIYFSDYNRYVIINVIGQIFSSSTSLNDVLICRIDTFLYFKYLFKQCHLDKIGWIAWSWEPKNYPQVFLDITEDGTFNTLHSWSLEVALTDSFSIKNISIRPKFNLEKKCD